MGTEGKAVVANLLSVLSPVVACAALFVSYSRSPLSTLTLPRLEYYYERENKKEEGTSWHHAKMTGHIENKSRYAAKSVYVDIDVDMNDPAPKIAIDGFPHDVLEIERGRVLLKIDVIPPGETCTIEVTAQAQEKVEPGRIYWTKPWEGAPFIERIFTERVNALRNFDKCSDHVNGTGVFDW